MKLQRTTLFLVVSAILLGGVVYFSETERAQKQEAAEATKQPIFSFEEDQVQSITIYRDDEEPLEFERVKGQDRSWRMKTPVDVPASDAAVSFLLDLLAEGKSDRSFAVSASRLKDYGLDKPSATVKVQLKNNQIHWLFLGKPDYNRSFLYARANPSRQTANQSKVLLVPMDFEYAVNRPMSEWQQSQKEIPQPSPTSESTSSPTPGAESSPTPASPQPSPTTRTSPPSPTPTSPQPSPTTRTSPPSPTPTSPQPSPTTRTSPPSPTPASPQPSPTTRTSPPSPTPASPQPSPTTRTSPPSPTPATPQPSPTSESTQPPSPNSTPRGY